MSNGLLVVVSGPSGTGKGTVCERLLELEKNLTLSISSTSRDIRQGETDGITYNYTTKENFEKMISDGCMLEYAIYNGNYYGTPRKTVTSALKKGQNVLLEIEVQGALKIKESFPESVLIFILPPSMEELRRRLISRGRENLDIIEARMETARTELKTARRYDYFVVNEDVDSCAAAISGIIENEKYKSGRNIHLIDNLLNGKDAVI